jgi:flagellar motor component MotA
MINQAMILSLVRQVLFVMGGVLVSRGYVDEETLNEVIGAIIIIGSSAWALWTRTRTGQIVNTAAVLDKDEQIVLRDPNEARTMPSNVVSR